MKTYPNPHPELAYYGLGEAARGQRHYNIALAAYLAAATQPTTSPLMQRRAHLRAGQVDDLLGHRQQAIQQYDAVIALGSQFSQAQEASQLRRTPYTGT
jgi:tetratricopeptide (TPR) repeat protein